MIKVSMRRTSSLTGALLATLLTSGSAQATYSIIAFDVETGQVGGAGTSCVGSLSVRVIYGVVPGVGVVAAQASVNELARDRAVMLLEQGSSAAEVIADITSPSFDLLAAVRQYAVIDVAGRGAVGFTGASTMAFANDVQGEVAPYVYSVQGNILTSAAVLSQAGAVFNAPGCDLADTLMLAIEAGALNGEGDSRCTQDGIPSDSAFIEVNLPEQGAAEPLLHLEVIDTSPESPLIELRAMYAAWRATHPCPEPVVNTDAGMLDAGMEDAGAIDVPVQPPQAGSMAPPATGGAGGAIDVGAGAGGSAATESMPMQQEPLPQSRQGTGDSSGCAVARGARPAHGGALALVFVTVLAGAWFRRAFKLQ